MAELLQPEHGYVLLGALAIGVHCFLQGAAVAKVRYSVFSDKYVEENLERESKEWKEAFGEGILKGCHPDNGLGRFSAHLSTADWGRLQMAQRAHLNYLETLSVTLWSLIIAGFFFPIPAALLAVAHLVGRQMYSSGMRKRVGARGAGFSIAMLTILAFILLGAYGSIRLIFSF